MPKERVAVVIDPADRATLQAEADRRKEPLSIVLREALRRSASELRETDNADT